VKYVAVVVNINGSIDSQGEVIMGDVTFPDHPVQFFRDSDIGKSISEGEPLGVAKLRKEGNQVFADIDTFSPIDISGMYAVPTGSIKTRRGNVITECSISGIMLTPSPADKNLLPLTKVEDDDGQAR